MNRSPASVSQIGPSVDFSPPREIQQMMDKKKYSVSNNPESLTFSERQGKLMQRAVGRDKYMEFLRPCRHHAAEQQLRAGPVARPKYQSCGTTDRGWGRERRPAGAAEPREADKSSLLSRRPLAERPSGRQLRDRRAPAVCAEVNRQQAG